MRNREPEDGKMAGLWSGAWLPLRRECEGAGTWGGGAERVGRGSDFAIPHEPFTIVDEGVPFCER